MPYLGNEPAVAYTSTTKDTFSGDASTTDFTMSKSANVNAVRVVVENVVQNPTVAYTCSGTTLSFTSAPPTGTNNIYVVHLGPPAATVAPPTTINNATTFTGGVTLKNETAEDTDGGRESIVTFQGTQSGNEITTLAQIQASHDGTSDDQAGDLIFKTNDGSDGASPTEVMRLDSGGTVNISSPSNARALKMQNGANNSASQITFLSDDGTEDSFIRNQSSSSAVDTLSLGTGGSERVRIDSSGDVLLSGMTAPTGSEQLALSVNSSVNFGIGIKGTSASNNAVYARFYNASGSTAGEIAQSGSTSTSFTTSSDYRIKENLTDISDGITRVKQLSPKRFNFIGETDRTVDGFLAHEAQTVVPESVIGAKDAVQVWKEGDDLPDGVSAGDNKLDDDGNTIPELQGIDQSKLVPLLTAALQEAIAKIETLETKVAALEAG